MATSVDSNSETLLCGNDNKLSDLISSSLKISLNRLDQYKYRNRSLGENQNSRRINILEQQKTKRNSIFEERRKNVNNKIKNDNCDKFGNEEIYVEETDNEMEWSSIKKVPWYRRVKLYQDALMYSEWLEEIPNDLSEKWIFVPCPAGKRTTVVSQQPRTVSYTKRGIEISSFKSVLPPQTILDCIWCNELKSFFIIDVIQWNGLSFKNCQTDFRFYWLDSKFQENPEISIKSESNFYPFRRLLRCPCYPDDISKIMKNFPLFSDNCPELDGILFYHIEAHYTPGSTPLVGWLKPFMLPDALNINLPIEFLKDKPDDYNNYLQYIHSEQEQDNKKKEVKKDKKRIRKNKMDCE